jgi:hypothetical protein
LGAAVGDRSEQLAGLLAELLDLRDVRLVAVGQHPGLELFGAQPAVAGPHLSGHRLDRDDVDGQLGYYGWPCMR